MNQGRFKEWLRKFGVIAAAIFLLTVFAIAGVYKWKSRRNPQQSSGSPNRENGSVTEVINPYQLALRKIEEDRGVPTGNKAQIKVPAELKLYQDKKRFLAIQVAEWRQQKYTIPHDFSELASMLRQKEFTILPTLGSHYVLYGVGLKANDELTHYDSKTGKSIPLFSDETEIEKELERLKTALGEFETKARELKDSLQQLKKGDRAARSEIQSQITATQKSIAAAKARRDLIESFYRNDDHKRLMKDEFQKLAELARDFDGQSFDLNDSAARKRFKIHLLSALRPPALSQLEEIAKAYQEKFDRPLPVTSLVRTIEYQRYLGESGNPNATQIDVPPHTTGLAFDVYTFYMAGDEQQFLLDEIARLEREGRVEALRENRHHIHVFAFADRKPPEERHVKESLKIKASEADDE
jgi:hypothetical protein